MERDKLSPIFLKDSFQRAQARGRILSFGDFLYGEGGLVDQNWRLVTIKGSVDTLGDKDFWGLNRYKNSDETLSGPVFITTPNGVVKGGITQRDYKRTINHLFSKVGLIELNIVNESVLDTPIYMLARFKSHSVDVTVRNEGVYGYKLSSVFGLIEGINLELNRKFRSWSDVCSGLSVENSTVQCDGGGWKCFSGHTRVCF